MIILLTTKDVIRELKDFKYQLSVLLFKVFNSLTFCTTRKVVVH